MARTKQTERKTNTGLPKATQGGKGGKGVKGRKGGGGGISSGGGGSSGGGSGSGSGGGGGSGSGSGGGRGGGGSSGGGGSDGNGNGKGNVPSGCFRKQLENRPPAAAPKRKKPYVWAFQEMRKLQHTTKLYISKYQMAR